MYNRDINERYLYQIASAATLLAPVQRQNIIEKIRFALNASEEHFNILYQQLIDAFAEFVQLLPTAYSSQLGGILDDGLLRAQFALAAQKKYENEDEADPLLTYVLFSSALLADLAVTNNNRSILISNKDGSFVREWWPHKGFMLTADSAGEYYRMRQGGGTQADLNGHATAILARQIMPLVGFNWIAQDQQAYNLWLKLLSGEKFDDPLLQHFTTAKETLRQYKIDTDYFTPTEIEILKPKSTELGEDFIEWLKQGLENKTIPINEYTADIHVIEGGLFLEVPGLFEKFSQLQPQPTTWQDVVEQLKKLGYCDFNETEEKFAKYVYTHENQTTKNHTLDFLPKPKYTPTDKEKLDPITKKAKYGWREGIEIFVPYSMLLGRGFQLPTEIFLISLALSKKFLKKQKKLMQKLRRIRKLKLLIKEIRAIMHAELQMKLKSMGFIK